VFDLICRCHMSWAMTNFLKVALKQTYFTGFVNLLQSSRLCMSYLSITKVRIMPPMPILELREYVLLLREMTLDLLSPIGLNLLKSCFTYSF